MRPSPELVGPLLVRDRQGRLSPYDECRLVESIRRAGPLPDRPEDLAAAVRHYLEQCEPTPVVGSERLAQLVAQVLDGAGATAAARAYRRPRTEPEAAGRLEWLLDGVEGVPRRVLREVAAETRRGLAAAGLEAAGPALVREWLDHLLARRGVAARGPGPWMGLSGRHLRGLLDDGPPGRSAEERVGRALLSLYAHEDVLPPDVWQAREAGLLDIGSPRSCCRVESLTLELDDEDGEPGAALEALDGLLSEELRLQGGKCAAAARAGQLPAPSTGLPWLLCSDETPAEAPSCWRQRVTVQEGGTLEPAVAAAARHPGLVELAAAPPAPGLVVASGCLQLEGLARLVGRGEVEAFLGQLEATLRRVLVGLSAWELLGPVRPARQAVVDRVGGALPARWSLALAGLDGALEILLGDTRHERGSDDLLAAVGERLRRTHESWRHHSRTPLAADRDLELVLRDERPNERPQADPAVAGELLAHRRLLLGVAADRPVPVPDAAAPWRSAFLDAYLRRTLSSMTTAPCA